MPGAAYVPTSHSTQSTETASAVAYELHAAWSHVAELHAAWSHVMIGSEPAGQSRHSVAPASSAYLPSGQYWHVSALAYLRGARHATSGGGG